MSDRGPRLALLLFAAALLAGCGRIQQTYVLPPSTPLTADTPAWLDLAYFAPQLGAMTSHTLLVRVTTPTLTVDAATARGKGVPDWAPWVKQLQHDIADTLWHQRLFTDIATPGDRIPPEHPDLTLDLAITRWREGNGFLRYFIGFGAGATDMQWEGQLRDSSGTLLMAFADRRLHPGGPSYVGSLSLRPFRGPVLIREDLMFSTQDLARGLCKVMGKDYNPNPPRRWERHPQVRLSHAAGKTPPPGKVPGTPAPTPGTRSAAILQGQPKPTDRDTP